MSGIRAIRPERLPVPDARLARELLRNPWGNALAYIAGACAIISLVLLVAMPYLLDLGGGAHVAIFTLAAAAALAGFLSCVVAILLLWHTPTPAKIVAWLALPLTAFLICAGIVAAVRVNDYVNLSTLQDPEGRFSITRPDADWTFLPLPVLGEGSEIEITHTLGIPLHVSIRTGDAKDNARAILNEISRLALLPSLRQHHHGEETAAENPRQLYAISSIDVIVGDETVGLLRQTLDKDIQKINATLESKRNNLKSLIESHGAREDIARLQEEEKHYVSLLDQIKEWQDKGNLSDILQYLVVENLQEKPPFPINVLWSDAAPRLDGLNAVRITVRGTTAGREAFFEVVQIAVRNGTVYVVDGFARKKDQADALRLFDDALKGFKFR